MPLVTRMLRLEWLGQTVANLCWIVSVFLYGIGEAADVLQLVAASSWLVANIAGVCSAVACERSVRYESSYETKSVRHAP